MDEEVITKGFKVIDIDDIYYERLNYLKESRDLKRRYDRPITPRIKKFWENRLLNGYGKPK